MSWMKSFQCKSNATDDVIIFPPKPNITNQNPGKKPGGLIPVPCSNSTQSIRDVVFLFPKQHPPPLPKKHCKPTDVQKHSTKPTKTKTKTKPKSKTKNHSINSCSVPSSPISAGPTTSFPTVTELPSGHSSRKVVEIIFGSSWSDRGAPFTGRVEMMFRVHNPDRTVARFEEYRSSVRARTDDVRCAVDGNEMMRFYCKHGSGNADDGTYDAGVERNEEGIRTFAGSRGAHESGGGGAGGRRSMREQNFFHKSEGDPDEYHSCLMSSSNHPNLINFDGFFLPKTHPISVRCYCRTWFSLFLLAFGLIQW